MTAAFRDRDRMALLGLARHRPDVASPSSPRSSEKGFVFAGAFFSAPGRAGRRRAARDPDAVPVGARCSSSSSWSSCCSSVYGER